MLENLVSVGPPIAGVPDWRSTGENKPRADLGSSEAADSFEGVLDKKSLSKNNPAKESLRGEQSVSESPIKKPAREEVNRQSQELQRAPQAPPGIDKKVAAAKGKAMQNIMDSFESEFSISSMRLMEAIASVNVPVQSPEEAAGLVVENLNLDEMDSAKAMTMLTAFFADLSKIDQVLKKPFNVNTTEDMLWTQKVQDRALSKQEKRDQLHQALDLLNQKFWGPARNASGKDVQVFSGNPAEVLAQTDAIDEGSAFSNVDKLAMLTTSVDEAAVMGNPDAMSELETPNPASGLSGKSSQEAVDTSALAKTQKTHAPQASALAALVPATESALDLKKISAEMQSVAQTGQIQNGISSDVGLQKLTPNVALKSDALVKNQGTGLSSTQADGSLNQLAEALQNRFQLNQDTQGNSQQNGFLGGEGAQGSQAGKNLTKVDKKSIEAFENFMAQPQRNLELNRSDLGKTFLATETAVQVSPQQKEMNIQQIMNQAQYLIKKGGGEMNVQMNPEGLGQIHLKVLVSEGKVNLQMAAETSEAKKTIESGLAELKSSLAAHKLSVDNVKVDVVNSTSTDVATQNQSKNQSDMSNPQQRDGTRQFWNQFQEQFGSRSYRDNLNEVSNSRGYGAKKRDPLEPVTETPRAQARKVSGKGDGLNLVA